MRKKRTRVIAALMAAAISIMCVGPAVYAATSTSDEEGIGPGFEVQEEEPQCKEPEIGPGYVTVEEIEAEPEVGPGYENVTGTEVANDGGDDYANGDGSKEITEAATTAVTENSSAFASASVGSGTSGSTSTSGSTGKTSSGASGGTSNGTVASTGTSDTTEKTSVTDEDSAGISEVGAEEQVDRDVDGESDEDASDNAEETDDEDPGNENLNDEMSNGSGTYTISIGDFEITLGDDTEEVLKGIVDVNSYLNLRTGAGTGYEVIGHLFPGTEVEVTGEDGGWYEITVPEQTGYVCRDYLDLVETAVSNGTSDETVLLMMMLMMMQESMKEPEPEPEPEPIEPEIVTTGGLTPEGNLTLVDDIGSSTEAGQQFITLVTKNGNYFYLIIDRDTDGGENVHFLNMVDERDLLDLMNEDEAAEYTSSATTVVEEVPVVITYEPAETEDTEEVTEETKKSSGVSFILVIVIVLVIVGAGVFFVFKKKQDAAKDTKTKPDPDADYGIEDTADAEPDDAYEFPEEDDYEPDDEIPDETDYEDDYLEDDPEDDEEDQ